MKKMSEKSERWTQEQITILIEAYQEEPCLYATDSPNYHNKRLRTAALRRVTDTVLRLRTTATPKECSIKFHSLRNQFNLENSKVKSSLTSGTGTDDIYTPSLWYYQKMRFLDAYVTLRKYRNSLDKEGTQFDLQSQVTVITKSEEVLDIDEEFGDIEYPQEIDGSKTTEQENVTSDPLENRPLQIDTSATNRACISPLQPLSSPSSSSLSPAADCEMDNSVFRRPSLTSPVRSTSSTSGVCTPNTRKKKNPRVESCMKEYNETIREIAKSLGNPITVRFCENNASSDPDLAFGTFMATLLRQFKNFQLKMEVMQNVMQLVTNALVMDEEQNKKKDVR